MHRLPYISAVIPESNNVLHARNNAFWREKFRIRVRIIIEISVNSDRISARYFPATELAQVGDASMRTPKRADGTPE